MRYDVSVRGYEKKTSDNLKKNLWSHANGTRSIVTRKSESLKEMIGQTRLQNPPIKEISTLPCNDLISAGLTAKHMQLYAERSIFK
jgi:hypothetical protein